MLFGEYNRLRQPSLKHSTSFNLHINTPYLLFLCFQLAKELMDRGWKDEVKELVALISKPHFKVRRRPSLIDSSNGLTYSYHSNILRSVKFGVLVQEYALKIWIDISKMYILSTFCRVRDNRNGIHVPKNGYCKIEKYLRC